MAKIYKITVHPDYRWSDAQISGRVFSKRSVSEVGERDMNDEIRRAGDPKNPDRVLLIEEVEVAEAEAATKKKGGKGSKPGAAQKPGSEQAADRQPETDEQPESGE